VGKAPGVTVFRNRAHKTFIGSNGAILVWDILKKRPVLSKKGKDGKEISKEATE
jgi:hypothetical protein